MLWNILITILAVTGALSWLGTFALTIWACAHWKTIRSGMSFYMQYHVINQRLSRHQRAQKGK